MGIIGHKSHEIMSRKEYLRSKKREKYSKFKIIPILLLITVVLLSIYVYKQLHLYNTVTKIANQVVEENALNNNKKIYYVGISYTKESDTELTYFSALDDSRKVIETGTNMSNIKVTDRYIYGVIEGKLYKIDRNTFEKQIVIDKNISGYDVSSDNVYVYIDSGKNRGIYKIENNNQKLIINGKIYQMMVDDKYIYVVMEASTCKSLVRFELNGKNKKILTAKQIVSNIFISSENIYYSNRTDNGKIYYVSKNGKHSGKITDNKILSYPDSEKNFNKNEVMTEKDGYLYYIERDGKALFRVNLKTKKNNMIMEKEVSTILSSNGNVYYTKTGDIGIYSYDETSKYSEKVTSARTSEYICIN